MMRYRLRSKTETGMIGRMKIQEAVEIKWARDFSLNKTLYLFEVFVYYKFLKYDLHYTFYDKVLTGNCGHKSTNVTQNEIIQNAKYV